MEETKNEEIRQIEEELEKRKKEAESEFNQYLENFRKGKLIYEKITVFLNFEEKKNQNYLTNNYLDFGNKYLLDEHDQPIVSNSEDIQIHDGYSLENGKKNKKNDLDNKPFEVSKKQTKIFNLYTDDSDSEENEVNDAFSFL